MNIQQLKQTRADLKAHWYYIRRQGASYSDNWIRDLNNVAEHIELISKLIQKAKS